MNNKLENQNISSHILFPSISVHYSIVETFICRVNNISSAKPKMLLFHSSKIEGSNWLFFLFGSYISIYLYLYIYIYLSISLYKYIYIYIYIYTIFPWEISLKEQYFQSYESLRFVRFECLIELLYNILHSIQKAFVKKVFEQTET